MRLPKQLNKTNFKIEFLVTLISFFQFNAFSQSDSGIEAGFQPSKDLIIKFKVARLGIIDSATNYRWDYYFDKYGNDTALYVNDKLKWVKKYERNKQGRISKVIQYDSSRIIERIGAFVYENNGSYTITRTEEKYKIISQTEEYNSKGKIQIEYLMDGGRHFFKYDSMERLSRIDSDPGLDGYDYYIAEYAYNPDGFLISLKTKNFLFSHETFEKCYYDEKGLLIRVEGTVIYRYDEQKDFYTRIYTYTFRT